MLFDIHKQDWDDDLLRILEDPARGAARGQGLQHAVRRRRPRRCSARRCRSPASPATSRRPPSARPASSPACSRAPTAPAASRCSTPAPQAVSSRHRLLTTVAYRLAGEVTYALEGSIFVAGAAVQWLRDALRLFEQAADTEALARSIADTGGVYLVPAFAGLGAPYWDPDARGAIFGLSRATRHRRDRARGARGGRLPDPRPDGGDGRRPRRRRDPAAGGAGRRRHGRQRLARASSWPTSWTLPVERPAVTETTALGAAYLAGLEVGLYPSLAAIAEPVAVRAPLRAADGRGPARSPLRRLARCRPAHAQHRLTQTATALRHLDRHSVTREACSCR